MENMLNYGTSSNLVHLIFLNRKITSFTDVILKIILNKLQQPDDIKQFFSLYSHDEIINILWYNMNKGRFFVADEMNCTFIL